jgi:putative transposase
MPRRPRTTSADLVYHVMNRAVKKSTLFENSRDFAAFEQVLAEGLRRVTIRLLAYCIMPNHWHLLLWPRRSPDLSQFLHWVTATHAHRWHASHGTTGTGAVYQGRFKAVPVQNDHHLWWVWRYVERNPVRAGLVTRAEAWRWSSLWHRCSNCPEITLDEGPSWRTTNWTDYVNEPQSDAELARFRALAVRNLPFGSTQWQAWVTRELGLRIDRKLGKPKS